MNQSILQVSDQAETCPEEYQDNFLFKNYTNIPSFNERQMFCQQYAKANHNGTPKQLEAMRQQIQALKAFQKQIYDEIQYLVFNFSYIIELAAKNISSKFSVLPHDTRHQKDCNSPDICRQQQQMKQKIQQLQRSLRKEQQANRNLHEELAQHKKIIKHQEDSLEIFKKKVSIEKYPQQKNEVNEQGRRICKIDSCQPLTKISKKISLQSQNACPLKLNRKINRSVEPRQLQKLDRVKQKFQILKKQLEHSKQQLLEYS